MIAAPGRVVEVVEHDGTFTLLHGFAAKIGATLPSRWAMTQAAKFGYHAALRLNGCRPGDRVRLGDVIVAWAYPDATFEQDHRPAGYGRWNSEVDGFRRLKTVVAADPIARLSSAEVAGRTAAIMPEVVDILLAG